MKEKKDYLKIIVTIFDECIKGCLIILLLISCLCSAHYISVVAGYPSIAIVIGKISLLMVILTMLGSGFSIYKIMRDKRNRDRRKIR